MIDVLGEYEHLPFLRARPTLGQRRYVSLLRYASAMVGNSSSGIIEAPFFGLPVVNIGSRQQGRQRAENVLDVPHDCRAIEQALRTALSDQDFVTRARQCTNPYGDGHAGERIAAALAEIPLDRSVLQKRLAYDLARSPHPEEEQRVN
jgi:UDP-N-acetylglucosamine 2-epimerase